MGRFNFAQVLPALPSRARQTCANLIGLVFQTLIGYCRFRAGESCCCGGRLRVGSMEGSMRLRLIGLLASVSVLALAGVGSASAFSPSTGVRINIANPDTPFPVNKSAEGAIAIDP